MSNSNPLRILIADDEPAIVRAFERLLESRGHHAHGARSADEALELASRFDFDVAVLDLRMPGGGESVIEALESSGFGGRLILMTGEHPPPEWAEGRVELLTKPFGFRQAVAFVERTGASDGVTEDPDTVLLALAGWPELLDRMLGGLSHDLNGHVASLDGLVELQAQEGADTAKLEEFMKNQVRGLAEVARMLSWITGSGRDEPELVAPGEILERAVRLCSHARGSERADARLEVEPHAPAARMARERVLRGLLLLIHWATRSDTGSSETRRVRIAADSEVGGGLRIAVGPAPDGPPEGAEALERLLALDGATVEWNTGRPPAVVVSFPAVGSR